VSFDDLGEHLEPLNLALEEVRAAFPGVQPVIDEFRKAAGAVKAVPSVNHLEELRDSEQRLLASLQGVLKDVRAQSVELADDYRGKQQFISVFATSANVVGAVASVAVILVFFTRLANDIKRLQNRASAIVAG
jgi:hypothetical protein